MEYIQFKAVLSVKVYTSANEKEVCFIDMNKCNYKEISGPQKNTEGKITAEKLQKGINYQGAGFSWSFFSSPGGIEGVSDRKSTRLNSSH